MIEQITNEQQKIAEQTEKTCQEGIKQQAEQVQVNAAIKIKQAADEALQKAAAIPMESITTLQTAATNLMSIINGYEDTSNPSFDPTAIIQPIKQALEPITKTLGQLPVPSIPGLKEIPQLLDALGKTSTSKSKSSTNPTPSPEQYEILNNLQMAIMSVCATLPTIMITLVFDMFNCIIKMFEAIKNSIGVPDIPPPLNLVPECVKLMPKIMTAVRTMPGQIGSAVTGTYKKILASVDDLQFPEMPEQIKDIKNLPACPIHSNTV